MLGVFVVAWLNLAIQPCAMAFGTMEEPDCPRCPPSHELESADHSMHRSQGTGVSDDRTMPCSTAATDCSLTDELKIDGRIVKLEPNDAPNVAVIGADYPAGRAAAINPGEYVGCYNTRSPPPNSGVPLNIQHCVFLK